MRTKKLLATASVLAAVAVAGAAPTALASQPASHGTAARPDFSAQAARAGLGIGREKTLQRRVDGYLAAHPGSKQTAANTVADPTGSHMVFAVPGEKYARDLNSGWSGSDPRTPAHTCPYGDFCAYSGANYTGDYRNWGRCATYEIPDGWGSGGSWYNNQTHGLQAVMRNKAHQPIYVTPPAPSGDPHGNWGPVWYVTNC